MAVDWAALRAAATDAMEQAYAPYSDFPVGAAGLVDDGRVVVGCNVENASYGLALCAECGLVSALVATGGGRLVAVSCVDGNGAPLMPCGRCRQLLWEHGGPQCLVDHAHGPLPLSTLLPHAFGPETLHESVRPATEAGGWVPPRLREWQGKGTVFVHTDMVGGQRVWTAYWERSSVDDPGSAVGGPGAGRAGILEEGPMWTQVADGVAWGRARTPRVVVVDADGGLAWAGPEPGPAEIADTWQPT
ncbi:MAG TPA: cytidine deaminase [Micromonosporaceae bacterium]